jgi:hypothetical protein
MHDLLKTRFEAMRMSLLAIYSGGTGLPNNMIGAERVAFVQKFLTRTIKYLASCFCMVEHEFSRLDNC